LTTSAIEVGDKVHIITRRRFDGDVRRHFAGEIVGITGDLCRVGGYAFVYNVDRNQYLKRPDKRVRVLSFANEGHVVNVLPRETVISSLEYRYKDDRLVVADGGAVNLDINELGYSA